MRLQHVKLLLPERICTNVHTQSASSRTIKRPLKIARATLHSEDVRHLWVNRAQTMRQELDGGYLLSPVAEVNGTKSCYYDNMRRVAQADLVISYAKGRVGRLGIAADFAISAPEPEEFGSIGSYWSPSGWLLPVR